MCGGFGREAEGRVAVAKDRLGKLVDGIGTRWVGVGVRDDGGREGGGRWGR